MDRLVSDNNHEIRELQDMVRKLKLQNEQLRCDNLKNGFVDNIQTSSRESNANRTDLLEADDTYHSMDVNNFDSSDDETCLYALPNTSKTNAVDIMKWVRQDVDSNYGISLVKISLMDKIEYLTQNTRRNIDSRTFTRPKKRVCRPTLGTMVESPLLEDGRYSSMQTSWHLTESLLIGETLDDISNPFSSGSFSTDLDVTNLSVNTPQHAEVVHNGAGRRKSDTRVPRHEDLVKNSVDNLSTIRRMEDVDSVDCTFVHQQTENPLDSTIKRSIVVHERNTGSPGVVNLTFQKMASEPRLHVASDTRLDCSAEHGTDSIPTFKKAANINVNNTFLKSSDPTLDASLGKVLDHNATFLLNTRSRSLTPSGLNSTFVVQDKTSESGGSNRSLRTVSVDSGADDDQMSTASDSSFSSSNRLLNVDDVQNIARMQEESLRQVMSTPFQGRGRESLASSLGENPPSPIPLKNSSHEVNHETHCQSDHSDNSSVDGGHARSSRSSRSSPGSSPFGSTQVLATNVREGQHQKEMKLVPPGTSECRKTEVPVAHGSGMVGLRPPAIRTRGSVRPVSGLPRPTAPAGSSNIPRLQSRIPAPSGMRAARSVQSLRPPTKSAWMDGCY